MKNKKTMIAVMVIAVLTVNVYAQQGGRQINSADDLKKYLDSQPANGPNNPIKVTMSVNDLMINNVANVISSAGKYVSLTLSGSALTTIPRKTFRSCKTLVSITIPASVIRIEGGYDSGAFEDCINLTSVTIGNSVQSIGVATFSGCISLTSVTIPNNVVNIYDIAFWKTGLTSITIGANKNYEGDFPNDFNEYYDSQGKKAGTYTYKRSAGGWQKESGSSQAGAAQQEFNNAESYFKRGVEYSNKGDNDKAIADFTWAIRLDPNFALAYAVRGVTYLNNGDYDKAIDDLNQAIRRTPNYDFAYYARGMANYLKKDYNRAIADYETEVRLDPKNDKYKKALEEVRQAQGR